MVVYTGRALVRIIRGVLLKTPVSIYIYSPNSYIAIYYTTEAIQLYTQKRLMEADARSLTSSERRSLASLSLLVDSNPTIAKVPVTLCLRFLLYAKGDVEKAFARLTELAKLRLKLEVSGTFEDDAHAIDVMLDGMREDGPRGYWAFGGEDASGYTTAWLLQQRAAPASSWEMAVTGVQAAHRFFYAATADMKSLRNGITLVVDLSGVRVTSLARSATTSRQHMAVVGDPYRHVIPVRLQAIYVVGCSMALRPVLAMSVLAGLSSKLRNRIKHLSSYDELLAYVPRAAWPASLRDQRDTPRHHAEATVRQHAEATVSQHARARIGDFEKMCAMYEAVEDAAAP